MDKIRQRRIPNRIKVNQKTIRVAANSILHETLLHLSKRTGKRTLARDCGLGSVDEGWICQQMELCGFVKRSYKPYTWNEERQIQLVKMSVKERAHQKAVGSYPELVEQSVPITRQRVMYEITDCGRKCLQIMQNAILPRCEPTGPMPHPMKSHSGRTKGYIYIEVPIRVDPEIHIQMKDKVW